MANVIWIKNGHVIDPASRRDGIGDVFVADGVIVEKLFDDQKKNVRVIDASGLVVCPGFVDLHARLCQPGSTARETIQSGSHAAAAGGYTTVVCMPDTKPPADTVGTVQLIKEIADRTAIVRILPTGTITVGHLGEKLAPIGSLKQAGVIAVTDGIGGVQNNEIMRRALEYSSMFGLVILDHCQDSSMTQGAMMHEGVWSIRLGLRGFPRAAEEVVVASDIILAHLTGARLHLQHITSGNSVELIRRAKQQGIAVTAEVSANHLLLTDAALHDYNTNLKLAAPLREEEDRMELIKGLLDGTIDAIVTDHSPVTPTEKDCEFDYAPFGAIGLETALSVSLEALYHSKSVPLAQVVEKLTISPARVLELEAGTLAPKRPADITIFDPNEAWVPKADSFFSRSSNSPYLGRTLRGKVRTTLVGGKVVYENGRIVDESC
ncbi:MAG: dihydroorotase [Puniceicoccales bacterium]|jgi:dihydroorotase|nr:dihydroorotase [Puniceicoccales bacterium]